MLNEEQNIEFRDGKRVMLGSGLSSLINRFEENDEASKKAYRTAQVQRLFKECAKELYGESAFLVLQHINAIYIITEKDKGQLKEALPDAKTIKRLVIYTNDSMVYADLDSRQEIIKLWFNDHNERLDKLDLYSSKMQMRKRCPYKSEIELMKKSVMSTKGASVNLIPPKNPQELMPLIEKIKDEKLKKQLLNLINS